MGKTKRKIHIREHIADTLELPLDALYDMTRITLISDKQLMIERFDGLYLYGDDQIIITVDRRKLTVTGSDLVINGAYSDRMLITGRIQSIAYSDY